MFSNKVDGATMGKTQSGGSETMGCPQASAEHFFGPRHILTPHICNSNLRGARNGQTSYVGNTTSSQVGVANTTTAGPS